MDTAKSTLSAVVTSICAANFLGDYEVVPGEREHIAPF